MTLSTGQAFGAFDILAEDHLGLQLEWEIELAHKLCRPPLITYCVKTQKRALDGFMATHLKLED